MNTTEHDETSTGKSKHHGVGVTVKKRRLQRLRFKRFNFRKALFVLPNLFTTSNIFCGFYAIMLASGDPGPSQFFLASLAIFFGVFFDMVDGRVARLTKTQSEFGVQLDSLADVVTFGLAPAIIAYKWGLSQLGLLGVLVAFLYLTCGMLRLARFNVLATHSSGSKKYFMGLPIPLAAGVLVAILMAHQTTYGSLVTRQGYVVLLVLALSFLMVSTIRYRSFKDFKPSKKSLSVLAVLVAVFVGLAITLQTPFALFIYFVAYIAMGLIEAVILIFFRRKKIQEDASSLNPSNESQNHHAGHS